MLASSTASYDIRWIIVVLGIAGSLIGMDIPILFKFVQTQTFINDFGELNWKMQKLLDVSGFIGSIFGCLLFVPLSVKNGRKHLFQLGAMFWVKASIIAICSSKAWIVVISRVLKGVSSGIYSVLIPIYLSELLPLELLGKPFAVIQFGITIAVTIIYLVSSNLNKIPDIPSFRFIWLFELFPALLIILLSRSLPETPKWLVQHGHYMRAQEVQTNMILSYKNYYGNNEYSYLNKFDLIGNYSSKQPEVTFKDLSNMRHFLPILKVLILQTLIQVSGYGTFMYLIMELLNINGVLPSNQSLTTCVIFLISLMFSFAPIQYMDNIQRRTLTISGSMIISSILLSISLITLDGILNTESIVIGLYMLYVAVCVISLSSVQYIYALEILPVNYKIIGMDIYYIYSNFLNVVMFLVTPQITTNVRWKFPLVFGIATLITTAIASQLLPETKLIIDNGNEDYIKNTAEEFSGNFTTRSRYITPAMTITAWNSLDIPGRGRSNSFHISSIT